ncbi:MAG: hypothetical protein Q9157_004579 [Trypethelium eluteriae]
MVSSKQLTTFSDFRPRKDDSDFLSVERYIEYLREYCTRFELWQAIHLRTTVLSVSRSTSGGHIVRYQLDHEPVAIEWECDAIAVCSGLHVTPNIPHIPGVENVPVVMHSSKFKKREQFDIDKTVLVIGSGETGADVAYLAVTSPTRRVVMSHRDGFHLAPKRNNNPALFPILGGKPRDQLTIPIDCGRASLFDTSFVHPMLRKHDAALWAFYDTYVKCVLWCTGGTGAGIDQWVGEVSPERNHASKIFFNKASKIAPYISAPYRGRRQNLIQKIRSSVIQAPILNTNGRHIDLAPMPQYFDDNGVVCFQDNDRIEYHTMKDEKLKPDMVIFCTGYEQVFPFLTDLAKDKAQIGRPAYPSPSEADVRNIWKHDDPTVGFIGFLRPSLGAIPALSEMQAQLWILNLAAPQLIPRPLKASEETHYKLRSPKYARIHYGIDHESYVYQLALDMDSALGFQEIISLGWRKSLKIPLVWALSANMNIEFRVVEPWKWDGAVGVLRSEMWELIRRRRLFYGK